MFKSVFDKVVEFSNSIGLQIKITEELDEFFKGDLDGVNIYCRKMGYEEMLFNVLHMIGHTVQWNVDSDLKEFGSVIYKNPDSELVEKLHNYEWEANCYGLYILHKIGVYNLDSWLHEKFVLDITYLTHFYLTGEKIREITTTSVKYPFYKKLVSKEIPPFTPVQLSETRNGIVIDFS